MADYTPEEIQSAVEQVVRGSVRRQYGALGTRNELLSSQDIRDAASGVFILKPNAPFYVLFLGVQRLQELLEPLALSLSNLIEFINNASRHVTLIDNLAPLANARVALDSLSSAASNRSTIFTALAESSAFARYTNNVQQFLDESSKNAKSQGQIVPTPQEARAAIPSFVRLVLAQQQEVLSRTVYLANAIEDFDDLQLPALLASAVISKAKDVLSTHVSELEQLSPQERLSKVRAVTLDLLVGRAAVEGLGSLRSTTTFALLEGVGAAYADSAHPALSAALAATILGPYPIFVGASSLDFVLDSAFSFQSPLPGSYLAQADSAMAEPYFISLGDNDVLIFDVETQTGTDRTTATLTPGANRTSLQLATDINAAMPPGLSVVAESTIQTFKFIGLAQADATGSPSDMDFILPAPGTWEAVGARQGDVVRVTDALSANFGSEFTVIAAGVNGVVLTCVQVSGPIPVNESLIQVETGVGKTLRMRIRDGFELQALEERIALIFPNLPTSTALTGNPYAITPVPQALSYALGARIQSRSTTAAQIAQDLPRTAPSQLSGVPRLDVSVQFVPSIWQGPGRSDPDNPNTLVAYRLRGRGTVGVGQLGLVFNISGATTAGVEVGDVMVIRETPVTADFNAQGTVVSVSPQSVVVDMATAITGGIDLLLEIGPNLTLASAYLEAEVNSSESADGQYFMDVRRFSTIPFEFPMEGQIPEHRGIGGQPALFTLALGYNRVVFHSTTTDLTTKVQITTGTDSAANRFFPSLPVSAVGLSPYFQIPSDPKSLQLGDYFEITNSIYNIVSTRLAIVGLELSNRLIQLESGLPTDFGSIAMSLSAVPPFARVRLSKKNNYTLLQEALQVWQELAANQVLWIAELTRLLGPVVDNDNPSLAAVSAAAFHVQQLLGIITRAGAITVGADPDASLESILRTYRVSPVEEVDILIHTYLERGAVRGIDILLQGRFKEFFGLSPEAMSYDGAMREALREVQRTDLPIRKTRRTEDLSISRTLGEWEDTDFEFDQSDTEGVTDVEIPGDFTEITPPGR